MKNNSQDKKDTIKYLIDGIYTKKEAKQALEVLRDKENDEIINEQMSKAWDKTQNLSESNTFEYKSDLDRAEKLLKSMNKPRRDRKLLKYCIIAASVAIIIGIGIIGSKYLGTISSSTLHYTQISTSYGETKEITLPDGTITVLNACSHLSFPEKFSDKERKVKLEGEAYFQVVKKESQPFVINTEKFEVKVLGTVFNIKAYSGDEIQSINVESGKVQVDMPDAMSRLSASEQIEINTKTDNYAKEKIDYRNVAVWRIGNLRFSKTPIEDVAKQLERVYNCIIIFEDGQTFNNLISGEHDNEGLKEVLESIRQTSGIKWKVDEKTNEIILYK